MKFLSVLNLLTPARNTPLGVTLLYAALAALWIVVSGFLLAITTDDALLQSRIELAKGLAFVAVTSGLLYLLLKGWRKSFVVQPTIVQANDISSPNTTRLALMFIALVLIVPLIDFAILRLHVPQTELDTYNNLKSIAELKTVEIENWLSERRGDAQGLADNPGFSEQAEHFLLYQKRGAKPPEHILNDLDSLRANHGYDSILFLDAGGRLLSSMGTDVDIPHALQNLLRRSLSSRQVQFSDLYRDDAGNINLDWVVPITISDQHGKRAVAAVVLRVAPERFLYPLIRIWPTASASGETLLVRREGETVLFLNQPRLSQSGALTVRGSLNDPTLSAAIAIRENMPGTVSGTDFRHVQVLTAYRPVAGTGWHLIAKIDRDEVLKPVWNLLYWISAIASVAVTLIVIVFLMFLRQQQRAHRLALRARSMDAVKESELRYRTLVGAIPDLVWLKDRNGIYLNCNRQFEMLYGAREADIIGKSDYDFVDKELADSFREHDHKAELAGKPSINEEWLTFAENGYRGLFETIKTPVRDADGNLMGILGIARDITERKQAAQKVAESERHFHSLFENMLEGYAHCKMIFKQDAAEDFVYIEVNQAFETLTGLKDVCGKNVSEVIPGIRESNPELFEIYGRVAMNGQPEQFETYVDGLGIWFSIAVYCPEKEYFVAVFDNITERKRAEESLHKLSQAVEQSTSLIVITDLNANIEYANAAFAKESGYSLAEAIGSNPRLLHSGKTPKSTYDDMWAHLTRGESWKGEFINRRKDGSEYIELALISPVFQADGRMTHYLAVKENITERKQIEKALHDSRESLSRLLNSMAEGAYGVDTNGNCTFVNRAFLQMLGYQNDNEVLGKHIHELIHHSHPDGSPYPESECRAYCSYRTEQPITASDEVFWRKDGVAVPVEYWSHTIVTGGVAIGAIITFFDITNRKAAEEKIHRLTQLYAALSQCNEAIVRCASEEELFPQICRDAVQFGGMKMAWIGMVEETSRQVRPVACYGSGTEYLEGIQISVDADDPFGRGPTGTAIRDNQPYWNQDFQLDPNTAPWQERRTKYGWKSSAALPLLRNGIPVGSITFYSDTVNAFDEEARKLLTEMAVDISFALDNFAREAERRHSLQEIEFKNTILQTQQETTLDAILVVGENGQIISYNQRFIGLWRIRPHLVSARADAPVLQAVADQVENPEAFVDRIKYLYEHHNDKSSEEIRLKDGRIIDRYSAPITAADGKYYGRVWYFRDISDRRRAEQELADSEQRFRSLVEQSLAGIYIIQEGKLVYVNPRFIEILGQGSADKLIGRPLLQFIAEADQGKVAENIRQIVDKVERSVASEFVVMHKDGDMITVGANATFAIYRGEPSIIGLIQDISEKKRDEERILNYIAQLKTSFLSTVQVATSLSEMRDPYTAGHERRVSEIAVAIATELGLDEQHIEGIKIAGYLHDIGKISIPAEILVKPGRLSATEYALVQGHAQAGYEVLKLAEFPWPVATVALQHHERMDGKGYPNGLKGDEILLESRIMAVADVVEAMASHRPYRPGLGIDKALAEIARGSGTSYDPVVADACLRLFRELRFVLPPY